MTILYTQAWQHALAKSLTTTQLEKMLPKLAGGSEWKAETGAAVPWSLESQAHAEKANCNSLLGVTSMVILLQLDPVDMGLHCIEHCSLIDVESYQNTGTKTAIAKNWCGVSQMSGDLLQGFGYTGRVSEQGVVDKSVFIMGEKGQKSGDILARRVLHLTAGRAPRLLQDYNHARKVPRYAILRSLVILYPSCRCSLSATRQCS